MSLTDRQRVELALIPSILLGVVFDGAAQDDEEKRDTERLLAMASMEPVGDLVFAEQRKIMRRVVRLHDEILAPYRQEGAVVAKVGLIAFYLLEAIVEADFLVLHADSDVQRALDTLLPALEPAANIPELDRSAQKAARKVMADLHGRGYFRGVTLA